MIYILCGCVLFFSSFNAMAEIVGQAVSSTSNITFYSGTVSSLVLTPTQEHYEAGVSLPLSTVLFHGKITGSDITTYALKWQSGSPGAMPTDRIITNGNGERGISLRAKVSSQEVFFNGQDGWFYYTSPTPLSSHDFIIVVNGDIPVSGQNAPMGVYSITLNAGIYVP